jgi:hypothetical protein
MKWATPRMMVPDFGAHGCACVLVVVSLISKRPAPRDGVMGVYDDSCVAMRLSVYDRAAPFERNAVGGGSPLRVPITVRASRPTGFDESVRGVAQPRS